MLLELLHKIEFIFEINFLLAILVAFPSGLIQGYAGFGGILVAVPFFAMLFGPVVGFALILFIALFGQGTLFLKSAKIADWRETGPAAFGSAITMSFGIIFLVTTDPTLIRNGMAVVILAITALLMSGWTYAGERKPIVGFCIGSISGGLTGGFGVPAFPITATYLLSSNSSSQVKRANVLSALVCGMIIAISGLIIQEIYTYEIVFKALIISPIFLCGSKFGEFVFKISPVTWFKNFTYTLLIFAAVSLLIF